MNNNTKIPLTQLVQGCTQCKIKCGVLIDVGSDKLGKNIGQQYCLCSLMLLMPLKSLSNCDYELKNLPRLILGPIHSNQVMGTDPVGSHHGTRNSRSNSINLTYPYQSHDYKRHRGTHMCPQSKTINQGLDSGPRGNRLGLARPSPR